MNFTVYQCISSIILDFVIKSLLVTAVGLAVTLGFVSVAELLGFAAVLTALQFICLFLGCTFAAALELLHIRLRPSLRFACSVASGNILFIGLFTTFFVLQAGPNDVPRYESGLFVAALVLAVANVIAILTVVGFRRVIARLNRNVHGNEAGSRF